MKESVLIYIHEETKLNKNVSQINSIKDCINIAQEEGN